MRSTSGSRCALLPVGRAPILALTVLSSIAFVAPAQPGPADGVWSQFNFPSALSEREYHGMVYDPVRERMIVIGGHPQLPNDVWALPLNASPAWNQLSAQGTPPRPRFAHSVIYQPGQDRVILFGGFDGSFRNDVWALSLAGTPSWSLITPAGTPPAARWAHVAVYDAPRERMIVFGGYDGNGTRNDVWALSLGATPAWTELAPLGQVPPARTNMDGVYDAARERLIVFGGFNTATQQFFNDTWALSLARNPVWSRLHPSGSPPSPRRDHATIYDAARRRMVVFGGSGPGPLDETYALTLGPSPAWSVIGADSRPSARYGHRAIYDGPRDRMVACAGYDGRFLADVWALPLGNPSAWSELPIARSSLPVARRNFGMAYTEGSIVLFGGDAGYPLNDVDQLVLGGVPNWKTLHPSSSPSARSGHHAIYDPPRGRLVVFGGYNGSYYESDTYAFSIATGSWQSLNALGPSPSGRTYYGVVYDPVRERMIVMGGHPEMLNDVWALSLNTSPTWQQVIPGGTPPSPRFAHTLVYQPGQDRVILFGGFDGSFRNDVWALSLAGTPVWSEIMPTGTPPAGRWAPAAVYDAARERMIVFGGYDGTTTRNDAWALSLAATPTWTQLEPEGPLPAARANVEGVYDPAGDRLIVFGGFNTTTEQFFNDTWALSWQPPAQRPAVQLASGEAPGRPRLMLSGVRPNPVVRELTISFSLADAAPAAIELLDIAGRRMVEREVGSLGAGDHELRLEAASRLAPGLYFVRLRQHDRALTARVLVAH